MVQERFSRIYNIITDLQEVRIKLKKIYKEESNYYNSLPEPLLYTDLTEKSNSNIAWIEFAIDSVSSAIKELEEVE